MASSAHEIRAGRAFVELFADDRRLVRGLKRARARLKAFGASVRATGRQLAGLGAAAAVPLGLATRVFAGFDDQMRAVQAVTGATGEQFDRLNAKAKLLGRTTSYTAAQVAAAMLELGRAGFDPSEIETAIGSVLSLARATGIDLAEATNIAGNTLRSFGLQANELGRVADVLTAAANNSAQTLTDLGEAMKYAAPVADAYGLTLEQTAKALGALANFGIKGSMAGNTLKNIMLQLAKPEVREQIEALGVAVTDSEGNFRDLGGILTDLGKAMADLPRPERLALMDELFGKRAVAGGIKLTAAGFERLNEAIDHAAGTAGRTAKVMDSGIGGAMRRLWSAVEGVAIAAGEALAPAISALAEKLSAAAGYVARLLENNRELVVSAAKVIGIILATGTGLIVLGAAIDGVAKAVGVLTTVAGLVHTALSAVVTVIGAMLSPIGMVIVALGALGTYLLYATGAGGKALDWLGRKFGVLKADALTAYQGIADALAAGDIGLAAKVLWLSLKLIWFQGIGWLKKLWHGFKRWFLVTGHAAFSGLLVIGQTIWHGLKVAWIELTSFLSQTWTRFTVAIHKAWSWVGNKLTKAWNTIKGLFSETFDADAANRAADQAYEAGIRALEARKHREIAERERRRLDERRRAREAHDARLKNIVDEHDAVERNLDAEYDRKVRQAEDAVRKAREDLKRAAAEAKRKRAAGERAADEGPGKLKGPGSLDEIMARIGAAAASFGKLSDKITVRGTFSAAAAFGLAARSSTAERTAKATENTARNTKKINDEQKRGQRFA